jgi:hypothetical protein
LVVEVEVEDLLQDLQLLEQVVPMPILTVRQAQEAQEA